MSAQSATAIVATGTLDAIVTTGTTTAIRVTVVAAGGGGGRGAGSSKQVGVSLVDKQIRDTVPPTKQKRVLESQFNITGKIYASLEMPVRIQSQLKALMYESDLTVTGKAYATLKESLKVRATPLAHLGARLDISSKLKESTESQKIKMTGEADMADFDRLLKLARLAQD